MTVVAAPFLPSEKVALGDEAQAVDLGGRRDQGIGNECTDADG
jgi:hypothetical protein